MIRPESRIDVEQRRKRPPHQRGTDDQNHRKRDLGHDQPRPQPLAGGTARVSSALSQHLLHIRG